MYRCIHVSRSWVAENLLTNFIQRTDCLELSWEGIFSEQALTLLQADHFDLVFASLPAPDDIILDGLLEELRRHRFLIASSIYPSYLYCDYHLSPIYFLSEPFSVQEFQNALNTYFVASEL